MCTKISGIKYSLQKCICILYISREKNFNYNPIKTKSKYLLSMDKFKYSGQVNQKGLPDGWGTGNVYTLENSNTNRRKSRQFGFLRQRRTIWAGAYTGSWVNGYPSGTGRLRASKSGPLRGSFYEGRWLNGGMTGNNGLFQYPRGGRFSGIFNTNGPVYGTLTYPNQHLYTGK